VRLRFTLPWLGCSLGVQVATYGVARAEPQASAGVTAGAVVENVEGPSGPGTSLHLGGRADVLFLRQRNGQMALGPYLDVATAGFRNSDVGGGLEWLVPLSADVPLVVSAGGLLRNGEGRSWAPGVEGTLFVGSRSYNFHSWYGLAAGLFVQTRWVPQAPQSADLVFGAQVDLELMALPVLLLWGAVGAGS
jgi:hypothetical protein